MSQGRALNDRDGASAGRALVLRAQVMAGFVCGAFYVTATTAVSVWKAAGWEGWRIGAAVACGNVAYAALVAWGGRVADRWGGRRTGLLGAGTGVVAGLLAAAWPEPAVAWIALLLSNVAGSFCFPSLAGWVARGTAGHADAQPLHRKVGGYNVGWSAGELAGFAVFGLLAAATRRAGFAVGAGAMAVVAGVVGATPVPPGSDAHDEAPGTTPPRDPRLDRLALTGRIGLMLACMIGAGLLSQTEKSLGGVAGVEEARRLAGLLLTAYAIGIVGAFVVLGRWTGWIDAPGRLLALQAGLGAGGLGLLASAGGHGVPPAAWTLAGCGAVIGLGFGAAYTGSLYYSLRLPAGASSSAGVHETFIGFGNILGPLLAGVWLDRSLAAGGGGLGAIGGFAASVFAASALAQWWLTRGVIRKAASVSG